MKRGLKTTIAHIKGDAIRPLGDGNKFIGNICSIAGIWKGRFMEVLAEKWPEAKDDFERWKFRTQPFIFDNKKPWPVLYGGSVDYTKVDTDTFVTHLTGQDVPVPETPFLDKSYTYLEEGLQKIAQKAIMCKASFHIQKSVAGFGPAVTWEGIEALIEKHFCSYGIRVIVYTNLVYLEDTAVVPDFSSTGFITEGLAKLPSLSDAISMPPKVVTKINYAMGEATSPLGEGMKIIAHICRADGQWKTDFGRKISKKWPEVRQEYIKWYSDPRNPKGFAWLTPEMSQVVFRMGNVQMVEVEPGLYIANMIAHWGEMSEDESEDAPRRMSYHSLAECLEMIAVYAKEHKATVHLTRHEEKLTDYAWEDFKKLIEEYLCSSGIEVTVYSTPKS